MEPFGLLHFLQTLLSPPATEAQPPPPKKEETLSPQTENPLPEKKPLEEKPTENQVAFLHFIERHESKAKQLKKKK